MIPHPFSYIRVALDSRSGDLIPHLKTGNSSSLLPQGIAVRKISEPMDVKSPKKSTKKMRKTNSMREERETLCEEQPLQPTFVQTATRRAIRWVPAEAVFPSKGRIGCHYLPCGLAHFGTETFWARHWVLWSLPSLGSPGSSKDSKCPAEN